MARIRLLPLILAVLLTLAAAFFGLGRSIAPPSRGAPPNGTAALLEAVREHARDRLVTVRAPVARMLSDDREGSPHQRFLIRVGDSVTVLIAHNIELAARVPLAVGDTVIVSGEYEWTPKGGTIHWTHLDPARHHTAGYIERDGRRYQ